ncbi:MAG: hypothetical protein ACTSVE_12695 [Candidatus Helarchaeota archaeon]
MELGWFLQASKGKTTDQKVDDLSELVVKVMETFVNVMEQIDDKLTRLNQKILEIEENFKLNKARQEGELNTIKTWLKSLEGRAVSPTSTNTHQSGVPTSPGPGPIAPPVPPKPKPKPAPKPVPSKPLSGMGARAALQSELKQLFARMKKE